MLYGVAVSHNTDDVNKTEMQIWKSANATLLFNKGCEAVFICESDAFGYEYEQATRRNMKYNRNAIDIQ